MEREQQEGEDMKEIAYPGLVGELAARGITRKQVFTALGVSQNAFYKKLRGKSDFTLAEAVKIHAEFFPDTDFLTLFRRVE
ncbi:MAG: helix-turn-helix transcriptional regulator [Oscillibacter sp.]|nr:helix-turn-helix transcriptional regulator [Oscillibacter sp.]